MRIIRPGWLLLAMLATHSPAQPRSDSGELLVGSERDFPPYALVDENGQAAGYSVDLIKAVAQAMGIRLRFVTGPWDSLWNGLVSGRLDALPVVARLPERESLVEFSLPHTETFDAFFVRRGRPLIRSLAEAKDREIVVMNSDAAQHALEELGFTGRVFTVSTIPEGLRLVASGSHDAFLCSKIIGTLAARQNHIAGLVAGPPISDYKRVFCFAARAGDRDLIEKLNQGLLIVKTNGEYDRIYSRWLAVQDPWVRLRRYVAPAAYGTAAMLLLALVYVLLLQVLVRRRTSELAARNAELRRSREGLEVCVADRTSELARANSALQAQNDELRSAQESLRESEARYRLLVEQAADGIFLADAHGRYLDVNTAGARMLGYSPEEIKRLALVDVLAPEELARLPAQVSSLAGGEVVMNEWQFRRKDGSTFMGGLVGRQLPDGRLLGIVRDITERKKAEEALRRSREELHTALAGMTDAYYVYDREWRFVEISPKALEFFDRPEEELLGKCVWDLYPQAKDSRNYVEYQQAMATGTALHFEAQSIISDKFFEMHAYPGPNGMTMYMRDITERRKAEEALREANSELRRSNEELERFAYVSSHDLQEPLRNVANYAELLRSRYHGRLDERADRYIDYVAGGAKRMSEMITDLLAFSRVASRKEAFGSISLQAVLAQARANLDQAVSESGTTIESDPLPEVTGDETQFVQLFQNLIGNAIKFRSEAPPAIRITVGKTSEPGPAGHSLDSTNPRPLESFWRISVSDNGIGIDPQYQAQIFELFRRLHRHEEYPGSGIGLALCRKIVERHGGVLTVESALGRGATFTFTLPVRPL
jgi:PAS domain S-box-containing protein